MEVPDLFDLCIICCKEPVGDPEHIIPQCIGGRLKARVLCHKCNHYFGARLVGGLTCDPSMRLAFEALRQEIPNRIKKQWNSTQVGRAEDGSVIRADADGRPIPSKGSGNSHIKPVEDARREIGKRLLRQGFNEREIEEWQKEYDQLPNDVTMTLPDGTEFVKRSYPALHADLREQFVKDQLPALIAFEFWALAIGVFIYDKTFDPVREYICDGTRSDQLTVEDLRGPKYECTHKIAMELAEGCIATSIQLFRKIAFRVTFRGFDYHGPDGVYYHDLRTGDEFCARSKADAARGDWIAG